MVHKQKYPIHILHIVGGMNTGGVETWLMHVLRRMDKDRFHFDFLVHTNNPCFYDEEIKSFGCRIIPCPHPKRPWHYARNFYRILKENRPYDVVHSHVHHFSGFTLLLARLAGVPKRIAHSHSDTSLNDRSTGFLRKLYLRTGEWLIYSNATIGLACSRLAAVSLYGKNWEKDKRWQILYCGIDLEPFKRVFNHTEVREELGLPDDAFVLGHVGRFAEQKNHDFLLDIFAEVARREQKAYLLLVGDGPLRSKMEQKAQRLGLIDKIIFAGVRPDVSRLMKGAMDVFVFPSLCEGLGLVLVEAQAAGLRCVISDAISDEVISVTSMVKSLSLHNDITFWVKNIIDNDKDIPYIQESLILLINSRFDIEYGLTKLCNIYLNKNIYVD